MSTPVGAPEEAPTEVTRAIRRCRASLGRSYEASFIRGAALPAEGGCLAK